ncbi:MAG: pantoate--beta-alanine ligase [Methylococcaceae bacterium]
MNIVSEIIPLRQHIHNWRVNAERIAFVPTMGNLHEGHLKLVSEAQAHAERVVVSIFVNPTQFSAGEDFDNYPRTQAADHAKLKAMGVDLVFQPEIDELYAPDAKTFVSVKDISTLHCGAFRQGHFDGVATVVCKLFNLVQPDIALLGLKDFQQLAIIRLMVRDLLIPVEIIAVDTVRESNGLAMSSRNGYLSAEEKQIAPVLYQTLCKAKEAVLLGDNYREIEQQAIMQLQQAGFVVDYFTISCYQDLSLANNEDNHLIILTAARLGKTRLIDNIAVQK